MSIHEPDADELEVRDRLRQLLGEAPDTEPAPTSIPPVPKQRPRDWLDDILDTPTKPNPAPGAPARPKRTKAAKQNVKKPKTPTSTASPTTTADAAPPRLATAVTATARRARTTAAARLPEGKLLNKAHAARTAYWASAAGAGWALGAGPWFLACLNFYLGRGFGGTAVLVVLALLILIVDSRTHALRGPGRHPVARAAGWITRIPLASALLAIALYKTR